MQKIAFVLACLIALATNAEQITGLFTVTGVGASNRTNSVYINTQEAAENTQCANKRHFKLSADNKIADKFYDAALVAFAQNKKLHIMYNTDECVDNSVPPFAFLME